MEAIFTQSHLQAAPISKKRRWAGLALSGVAILFLSFDSIIKLLEIPAVAEGSVNLGYPPSLMFGIGLLLAVCLAFYVIPRTSILGAILLTGYLGGAVATHVRVGNPLFSHTLFPIYVAILIWGGLYLRERRLRALVPLLGARD
jgi:hypothetical protein